jgi:dGTP triphosphohydrolase
MTHPEGLPHLYQERAENEKLVRVVCDYIGGMTDTYIEELRKKLISAKKAES